MSRRVVVTGVGLVTPLGNDVETTWQALRAGKSGVGPITAFDTTGYETRFAAQVRDFDVSQYLDRKTARHTDPFAQYAVAATQQALTDAEFRIDDANADDVGVIIGSGIGGLHACSDQFQVLFERGPGRISPFFIAEFMANSAAGLVSILTGARGVTFATVSACATGANAIGEAAEIIKRGDAIAMLAGGAEACVTPITMAAFAATRATSRRNDDPARASRPFDATRDGFVVGEGAGMLLLEEETHAKSRGAHIYAELIGYGCTADAHHMVEPAPGGVGLARAIRRALAKGEIAAEQVDYINAHGTGTIYNDRSETQAIKSVFGAHAYHLMVSSTKSMIGHTFGAAGAIEAIVTALSLDRGMVTPTINLTTPDPECDLDYTPLTAREAPITVALSNSMGFGGHNTVLALRRGA